MNTVSKPNAIVADLHSHSTHSDGTQNPQWLAQTARVNGVTLWALTDHDTISGVPEAAQTASKQGIDFLSGVEISVSWQEKTIHILGLGVDETNSTLCQGLAQNRTGRTQRAQLIDVQLAKIGICNTLQGALQYAGNPSLISRSHFARHLITTGVCANVGEAFQRYLGEGTTTYVPQQWASLEQAIHWIHAASGMAIVAHPARHNLTTQQENTFFDEFIAYGGQAVEVLTSAHSQEETTHYQQLAQTRQLYASCGSDFHDPKESCMALGGLPPLPDNLTPVWQAEALASRVRRA